MTNSEKQLLAEFIDRGLENEDIENKVDFSIIEIVNFKKEYNLAIKEDERDVFLGLAESKATQKNRLDNFQGEEELKIELEKAAFSILFNLKNKVNADSEIRDLKVASDIVSSLNNSLIQKESTRPTVNIQNNVTKSSKKYQNLLDDMVKIDDLK